MRENPEPTHHYALCGQCGTSVRVTTRGRFYAHRGADADHFCVGSARQEGDLAARIEAAYMRRTGSTTPRGARTWFARQAKVHKQSVRRWLSGERPLSGPALAVLEMLEDVPPVDDAEEIAELRAAVEEMEAKNYALREQMQRFRRAAEEEKRTLRERIARLRGATA